MIRRGEIYIVNFGKRYQSNIGKARPAIILSSDDYLKILNRLEYPTLLVVPLTTNCVDNPDNILRVQIFKRDTLIKTSEAIINWSCSVDYNNLDREIGPLTSLTQAELMELEEKYLLYCGLPVSVK